MVQPLVLPPAEMSVKMIDSRFKPLFSGGEFKLFYAIVVSCLGCGRSNQKPRISVRPKRALTPFVDCRVNRREVPDRLGFGLVYGIGGVRESFVNT